MACTPHDWKTPAIGDDALECEKCGRALRFYSEMTPNIRASIMASTQARQSPGYADDFRKAMDAAAADAGRRAPSRPLPPPSPPPYDATPQRLPQRKRRP